MSTHSAENNMVSWWMVKHPQWEDLRFPASAVNPPGGASGPALNTTNGTYLFDATGTELVFGLAQMPHSWAEGSAIKPHVHWMKTTSAAGNVFWQLDYKMCPIGEILDSEFTTLSSSTSSIPDTNTAGKHLVTEFGIIDMTGKTSSDMIILKLSRIGGNAADTYAADAEFLEFDLHYQVDSLGSANEFSNT